MIYDYRCGLCNRLVRLSLRVNDRNDPGPCPMRPIANIDIQCGGKLERVVSAPQVVVPTQHRAAG